MFLGPSGILGWKAWKDCSLFLLASLALQGLGVARIASSGLPMKWSRLCLVIHVYQAFSFCQVIFSSTSGPQMAEKCNTSRLHDPNLFQRLPPIAEGKVICSSSSRGPNQSPCFGMRQAMPQRLDRPSSDVLLST